MLQFEIQKLPHFGPWDLPGYETAGSAGMDLRAALDQPLVLKSLERCLIPTGLKIAIHQGFEGQIRPRSGMAFKHGITVVNAPGTIDSDYRGEVKIAIVNLDSQKVTIESGMRVAQLVISPVVQIGWKEVEVLSATQRNTGGFGSTGVS